MNALLDTHILLWWLEGKKRLSRKQRRVIEAADAVAPLHLADISLWEVAALAALGRIELDLPLRDWLERASAPPLVRVHPITPAVAAEVAALPDAFHRDPADRILVATARVLSASLVTSDLRIIESGLVATVG